MGWVGILLGGWASLGVGGHPLGCCVPQGASFSFEKCQPCIACSIAPSKDQQPDQCLTGTSFLL